MLGTQTLDKDLRIVKPDAQSRQVAAEKDKKALQIITAEKRTLRVAKEAIERTKNKGTQGLLKAQFREIFTEEALKELSYQNFTSAIRCIKMAFDIENPKKLKDPELHEPLIYTLMDIAQALSLIHI